MRSAASCSRTARKRAFREEVKPPQTLASLVEQRAECTEVGFTFLEPDSDAALLSYGQLEARTRVFANRLTRSLRPGDRALMLFAPGLEFIVGFFGCIRAGGLAVPAFPPDPRRFERTLPRLLAIINDAKPTVLLTSPELREMIAGLAEGIPELGALEIIATDETEQNGGLPALKADDVAMIQYTSGSTGTPRGVCLSHHNLLHNSGQIHRAFGSNPQSQGVIWLPVYHDMGLIGGVLQPLYGGFPVTLMSPIDFLRKPFRWLEAISKTGATISGGPNFAYELCVRKVTPAERAGLDLSTWQVAFTGAEPVRKETLDAFARMFEGSGFSRRAFLPCYGLAEATLMVSAKPLEAEPTIRQISARGLREGQLRPAIAGDSIALAGVGGLIADTECLIVDRERGVPALRGTVGEIWLRGESVAKGYFGHESDSTSEFAAQLATGGPRYLRTGDLGFLDEQGELFITGRSKDLIILRGRNHYPQDIELSAERAHASIRGGCVAAVGFDNGGEEHVVVLAEITAGLADPTEIGEAIVSAVAIEQELRLARVVLLPPGALPKTSSGKLQRRLTKSMLLDGAFEPIADSQFATLAASAADASDPTTDDAVLILVARQVGAPIGHDSLVARGLDSLGAAELAASLEAALGVPVAPEELLSLEPFVTTLERLRSRAPHSAPPTTDPDDVSPALSFAAQRMWLLQRSRPDRRDYVLPLVLHFEGPVDAARMEQAFRDVTAAHACFRSEIRQTEQGLAVSLAASPLIAFESSDLSLTEAMKEAFGRPIRLDGDALARAVFVGSPRGAALIVCMHHLVMDGWSVAPFVAQLSKAYGSPAASAPSVDQSLFAYATSERRALSARVRAA